MYRGKIERWKLLNLKLKGSVQRYACSLKIKNINIDMTAKFSIIESKLNIVKKV